MVRRFPKPTDGGANPSRSAKFSLKGEQTLINIRICQIKTLKSHLRIQKKYYVHVGIICSNKLFSCGK